MRRPEQSIAYDLIDVAAGADWHPSVTGDDVTWRRGEEATTDPMPTQALRDALVHHGDAVIAVLLWVPGGCVHQHVCEVNGVCPDEIQQSACAFLVLTVLPSGACASPSLHAEPRGISAD